MSTIAIEGSSESTQAPSPEVTGPEHNPHHSFYSWYANHLSGGHGEMLKDDYLIMLLDSNRADVNVLDRALCLLQEDPFVELVDFSGDLFCATRGFFKRNPDRFPEAEKLFHERVVKSYQ